MIYLKIKENLDEILEFFQNARIHETGFMTKEYFPL